MPKNYWHKSFYMLSALLMGFLSGALFGTVLPFARSLFFWDGLIIASLLVVIESLSYIAYKPYQPSKDGGYLVTWQGVFLQNPNITKKKSFTVEGLSFFKIGLMIGFFVDAFKVGS